MATRQNSFDSLFSEPPSRSGSIDTSRDCAFTTPTSSSSDEVCVALSGNAGGADTFTQNSPNALQNSESLLPVIIDLTQDDDEDEVANGYRSQNGTSISPDEIDLTHDNDEDEAATDCISQTGPDEMEYDFGLEGGGPLAEDYNANDIPKEEPDVGWDYIQFTLHRDNIIQPAKRRVTGGPRPRQSAQPKPLGRKSISKRPGRKSSKMYKRLSCSGQDTELALQVEEIRIEDGSQHGVFRWECPRRIGQTQPRQWVGSYPCGSIDSEEADAKRLVLDCDKISVDVRVNSCWPLIEVSWNPKLELYEGLAYEGKLLRVEADVMAKVIADEHGRHYGFTVDTVA
ncbi:hypothetical protein GQ607_002361 [Colletotrichum asianum]|uniref:Uncharacterized protein n=1 Tax=Colletotrichum asianum TaxID=702518 RepID=A0A8H3WTF3_9PEZI|nr:hypothetical protein GQ607_002361 [Colletotrichum asianum]